MAAQAGITEHGRTEVKYWKEAYEKLWIIPDWLMVQQNEDSLRAQTFHFETRKSKRVKTKWEIGFNVNSSMRTFGVYLKLLNATGFYNEKLQTTISASLSLDSKIIKHEKKELTFKANQIHEFTDRYKYRADTSYWGSISELTIKFNLSLLEPETAAAHMKMVRFHKNSRVKVGADLATLLDDTTTTDLKILTSDEKELFAHKAILKARCPVFDSMFRSRMSEDQTGIVDVKDVTGKTMGIFLHYFYSGELLPSWKDDDTVVEFTYAAGKYQLTELLELLDDMLGTRDKEEATQTDVLLIELAGKLGLKNAEQELLKRIAEKTNKVKSHEELFGLYGIGKKCSCSTENFK